MKSFKDLSNRDIMTINGSAGLEEDSVRGDVVYMHVDNIQTASPFSDLFLINPTVNEALADNMRVHGFDETYPIILWNGIVVDGHSRLAAAKGTGIETVPVIEREFDSEDEAFGFALRAQVHRRNLTDADIFRLIQVVDKRKTRGGKPDRAKTLSGVIGASSEITAKLLDTYRGKIEKARAIHARGSDEIKEQVLSGEITINKGYTSTPRLRKKASIKDESPLPTSSLNREPIVTEPHSSEEAKSEEVIVNSAGEGTKSVEENKNNPESTESRIEVDVAGITMAEVKQMEEARKMLRNAISLLKKMPGGFDTDINVVLISLQEKIEHYRQALRKAGDLSW